MIDTAILRTLAYHHLFQDPLTVAQIHKLLITPSPCALATVRRAVDQMWRHHELIRHGSYYVLLSFLPEQFRRHRGRIRASQEKLAIAWRAAAVLTLIPWVKLVAVTGGLAMEHADESDDIDLLVVTARHRLWLTRPLAVLLVALFFKRRKPIPSSFILHPSSFSNTLCLNLWLDESALSVQKNQRNLYTAHELAQMVPLVNKNQTQERMMEENRWGRRFLANAWKGVEKPNNRVTEQPMNRIAEEQDIKIARYQDVHKTFFDHILNILNTTCYKLQLWYMRPKMTTERVSLHAAYFHPGDRGKEILEKYKRILDNCHIFDYYRK